VSTERRILITGASRGIGLELARTWAAAGCRVFAACRRPGDAPAVAGRVDVLRLDVTDDASIAAAARAVAAAVDGLDVLINNAGVYPGAVSTPLAATTALGSLDAAAMLDVFRVNTVAPVLVAQAFAPLLRRGTAPRLVNVSSDAGSLAMREGRGCRYTYPASKAALNMMTRCLAHDLRADGVIVVSVHPGFVRTDMGGPDAPLAPADTVPSLVRVIDGLTMESSGHFLSWDGKTVAW
jgi:NAD(P)-dependent dehydrogenase (short-subunit alcohol dehydrogenase family)